LYPSALFKVSTESDQSAQEDKTRAWAEVRCAGHDSVRVGGNIPDAHLCHIHRRENARTNSPRKSRLTAISLDNKLPKTYPGVGAGPLRCKSSLTRPGTITRSDQVLPVGPSAPASVSVCPRPRVRARHGLRFL
jgi:hypothetical protein